MLLKPVDLSGPKVKVEQHYDEVLAALGK